jgi:hypothetical protein
MRFCSRCGFLMEGTMTVLAHGGVLPQYQPIEGERQISARRKGVKQGALLFLVGALLVPLLGVFSSFANGRIEVVFEFFAASAAIICFLGGALRMLYAGLFEEGAPARPFMPMPQVPYAQPPGTALPIPPGRMSALPPAPANSALGWRARPQTAEILHPTSVTDNTTRLLGKSEPESN